VCKQGRGQHAWWMQRCGKNPVMAVRPSDIGKSGEAKALAAQPQDLWEREALLRVATRWQLIAAHKAAKQAKQAKQA
jgi:hypothetical protein